MAEFKQFEVTNGKGFDLKKMKPDMEIPKESKEKISEQTKKNLDEIAALQDKLYADGKEGLIIILQAMDAAGKDSTVKHVMSSVNPQGIDVFSFKQPSATELAHDFLWRIGKCIPERGKISLFNRSYYEDVLVVKVHEINKTYKMPKRCTSEPDDVFFGQRYEDIRNFEEYLYRQGYRIVKIFLNVSKDEQKKRFLERIDKKEKNWKFSSADITERKLWDKYQKAYQDAIEATATEHCPWYVVPADQKWYTRLIVSEVLLDVLQKIAPEYPTLTPEAMKDLESCKAALEGGKTNKAK
ncbi:MAG: polyphosphate kinase 2 family protein [Lachnospiraceae bacterium]|jgi:PPK2 family polyphosphate:nucleotide phosphotransferase|nr:polyphosphate kinase 2 family protein [Lachnospiraceae bacterium]